MAQRYRREAENLRNALDREDGRSQAVEHLRALIDKIVLTPEKGREDLRIDPRLSRSHPEHREPETSTARKRNQ